MLLVQQDDAAATTNFEVKFSDDFGTECEKTSKCPNPVTNKVNCMVDASLLLKSVGGLSSISLEQKFFIVCLIIYKTFFVIKHRFFSISQYPCSCCVRIFELTQRCFPNHSVVF